MCLSFLESARHQGLVADERRRYGRKIGGALVPDSKCRRSTGRHQRPLNEETNIPSEFTHEHTGPTAASAAGPRRKPQPESSADQPLAPTAVTTLAATTATGRRRAISENSGGRGRGREAWCAERASKYSPLGSTAHQLIHQFALRKEL